MRAVECGHDHRPLADLLVEVALALYGHDALGARAAEIELERVTRGGDGTCATVATRTPGRDVWARGRARAAGTAAG
jgi:hypothetical protein